MSTLNVSNITDGTDTVETGYVVNGSAKAFEKHQINGTIDGSLNVSSVTDSGTGDYTINFSSSMNDNKYTASLHGSAGTSTLVRWMVYRGETTTGFGVKTYAGSSQSDMSNNMTVVHGDLA